MKSIAYTRESSGNDEYYTLSSLSECIIDICKLPIQLSTAYYQIPYNPNLHGILSNDYELENNIITTFFEEV